MKARSIMTVNVTCILPETTLDRAWRVMKQLRARHLPVITRDGRVAGMLSDRDLLVRAARGDGGSMAFPDEPVASAMSADVISVDSAASASRMASVMLEHKIDALPVVAPDGRLKGLVTSSDLLALLVQLEEQSEPMPFAFELRTEELRATG